MTPARKKTHTFILTGEVIYVADEPTSIQELRATVVADGVNETEDTPGMEIVSGEFKNRKVRLRGSIDQPVPVTLSVWKEEKVIGTFYFVLQPNSKFSFRLLDNAETPKVYLKGSDHRSTNPERKFTFSGDLKKFRDYHPELTMVRVYGTSYELDGSTQYTSYGPVLVDNGKLSIEGDIDKPTLFSIWIEELNSSSMITLMQGIFEPGFNYVIEHVENSETIVISADREGLHTQLISDWLNDPEYLKIREQQHRAFVEFEQSLEANDETSQDLEVGMGDTEKDHEEVLTLTFATVIHLLLSVNMLICLR